MFNRKIMRTTLILNGKEDELTWVEGEKINQVSHEGLRVSFLSNFGNGSFHPGATIIIYGLPIEKIDKIIRLKWGSREALGAYIKVEAGEEGEPLMPIYYGNITFARLDTTSAPDVAVIIESLVGHKEKQTMMPATSWPDGAKFQNIVADICGDIGWQLENNNVDMTIGAGALERTSVEKIANLCSQYKVDMYIEPRLVAIANQGHSREITVPIVSPSNGLIGYPTSTVQGVSFQCLYNPLIRFGGKVQVKDSAVKMANGEWLIIGIRTHLEANTPNGNWVMEVNAKYAGG